MTVPQNQNKPDMILLQTDRLISSVPNKQFYLYSMRSFSTCLLFLQQLSLIFYKKVFDWLRLISCTLYHSDCREEGMLFIIFSFYALLRFKLAPITCPICFPFNHAVRFPLSFFAIKSTLSFLTAQTQSDRSLRHFHEYRFHSLRKNIYFLSGHLNVRIHISDKHLYWYTALLEHKILPRLNNSSYSFKAFSAFLLIQGNTVKTSIIVGLLRRTIPSDASGHIVLYQ